MKVFIQLDLCLFLAAGANRRLREITEDAVALDGCLRVCTDRQACAMTIEDVKPEVLVLDLTRDFDRTMNWILQQRLPGGTTLVAITARDEDRIDALRYPGVRHALLMDELDSRSLRACFQDTARRISNGLDSKHAWNGFDSRDAEPASGRSALPGRRAPGIAHPGRRPAPLVSRAQPVHAQVVMPGLQESPADETVEWSTMGNPRVDGFEVKQCLGRGGMGEAWRATQLGTRREVALKILHPFMALAPGVMERFQREVEIMAQLDHPAIARVYESGLHRDMPFYALELVDGVPLDQYLRNRGQRETLELFLQVCEGVQAAHGAQVAHLDLKPGNILVDEAGSPHILDFGVARRVDAGDAGSEICGTPAYMSPEQARGGVVDQRSDVYALGIMLYRQLTGQAWMGFRVSESGQDLEAAGAGQGMAGLDALPPVLQSLLARALQADPGRRYSDAGALVDALRAALAELDEPQDSLSATAGDAAHRLPLPPASRRPAARPLPCVVSMAPP